MSQLIRQTVKQTVRADQHANDSAGRSSLAPNQCAFCLRVLKDGTTAHHLIPRTCHKNRWFQKRYTREQMRRTIPACQACHRAIHRFVPREKELGRDYNTLSQLMSHAQIAAFVAWVSRQK